MATEETKTPATQEPPPWLTRQNIKLAVWLAFLISAVVIVVQNWDPVKTKLLFIEVETSQSLLLILMLVIGLVLGLTLRLSRKKKS
jgi:uncharacterized integral membrane protein